MAPGAAVREAAHTIIRMQKYGLSFPQLPIPIQKSK